MAGKTGPAFLKPYLVVFNLACLFSWAYLLYLTVDHYFIRGLPANQLWNTVEIVFKIAQSFAVLEVVHAMLGWVRSPVFTTFLQVLSRIAVLWVMINLESQVALPWWGYYTLTSLIFAWGVTEVVRYLFYGLKLFDIEIAPLSWCRYSFFLVLYPLGVASELSLIFARLPYIYAERPLSILMPNKWNFAIDLFFLTVLGLITYIPGFPMLFSYMLTQRAKVIGGASKKKTA